MIIIFCAISVIVYGIAHLFGYRRPTKVEWTNDNYSIALNDYNRDYSHIIYLRITGETDAEDVDSKDSASCSVHDCRTENSYGFG